jgi:hypothetical protein
MSQDSANQKTRALSKEAIAELVKRSDPVVCDENFATRVFRKNALAIEIRTTNQSPSSDTDDSTTRIPRSETRRVAALSVSPNMSKTELPVTELLDLPANINAADAFKQTGPSSNNRDAAGQTNLLRLAILLVLVLITMGMGVWRFYLRVPEKAATSVSSQQERMPTPFPTSDTKSALHSDNISQPLPKESSQENVSKEAPTKEQAAALLFDGRRKRALSAYQQLARQYPNQPVYQAVVAILKRDLGRTTEEALAHQ